MSFSRRSLRLFSALSIGAFFVCSTFIRAAHAAAPGPASAELATRLGRDIARLTSYPSRAPGTPGNIAAAAYIKERFHEIGLQRIVSERFRVTVPVTQNASLNLAGRSFPLYPVYPNGVAPSTTPPQGITAPLLYAGMGTPFDLSNAAQRDGIDIKGAIVALDFNSGMNWITAGDLGARAVIFLEPKPTGDPTVPPSTRGQAERKFASLPVELPRYYATRQVADAIRTAAPGASSTVKSAVLWNDVPVDNIVGWIKGSDPELSKQTVVLSAYYDSMALTPDLAPGAEAAANCASLLELARYYQANPPKYTLMIVVNGAHHVALAGMRNFAARHFIDSTGKATDDEKAQMTAIRAFVGLDLTSRSRTVGLFAKSWFYNQMTVASENILLNQYFDFAKSMYGYAQERAKRNGVRVGEDYVDGVRSLSGRSWRSYLTSLVALDSEVATMAQKAGLSFVTANDGRVLQDTPFDTPKFLNYDNLTREVTTVTDLLTASLNSTPDDSKKQNDFQTLPTNSSLSANFGYVIGRGIYRDVVAGTSFLPDTPLPDEGLDAIKYKGYRSLGLILDRTTQYKSYAGVRGAFIERANYSKGVKGFPPSAQYVFVGPRVGDSKGGGTPISEIEAYSVDAQGRIVFAPDQGAEKASFSAQFTLASSVLSYKDQPRNLFTPTATTMCFPCREVSFLDTLDQRYFTILKDMNVLDGMSDANPQQYGFLKPMAPNGASELEPIAVVFGKPGDSFKLIMMQGMLGKRLVLLNTRPGETKYHERQYEGIGVPVPADDAPPAIYRCLAYGVARDLWTLDQQRIALLKSFGISNERVQVLHKESGGGTDATAAISAPQGGAIESAGKALAARHYDTFYREARRAFGLESRAYPDVEATSQDVLKGILFYMALLLPFSFFCERLLFGSPDIKRQIIWTSCMFLIVFGLISQVHPAFKLAMTPFIILLAFIILALTVFVTSFLSSKFEAEIKRLKQGVHFADVGRLSAISAALGLGVANMRRRPTRTALTCITLILLTFTVLSFTSVTASISNFARLWGTHQPRYSGMMVRQPDWRPMEERAIDSLSNEFRAKFKMEPALRSWYLSRDQGESLQLRVTSAADPNRYFHAPALLGMSPQEAAIGSPVVKTLISGRWFEPGDRNVCLLPRSVLMTVQQAAAQGDAGANANGAPSSAAPPKATGAAGKAAADGDEENDDATPADGLLLGMTQDNALGKTVIMAGMRLKVIGIFDDSQWSASQTSTSLRDLDDEPFTPVDYQNDQNKKNASATDTASQQGEEVQVQSYQHMRANALLILPYQTVIALGGTPRSLAAGFGSDATVGTTELQALLQRAALGVFGSTPNKSGVLETRLYSSVESTSYEGFAALVVPILIAALIIANTMLGSVFERTREIGIYSAVGLAPIHIAALFIAEATVYAVLGSISGYLVAQTVAKIITATGVLQGITLNYSSSSAVLSTLIVMITVLLSTIYPAVQASKMSQSDSDTKFKMSIPLGDLWRFQFPFTISGRQTVGVSEFLTDFFETHTDTSVGSFYTDKVDLTSLTLREAVALLNALPEGTTLPPAEAEPAIVAVKEGAVVETPRIGFELLKLEDIHGHPDLEVYRVSMRVWLAPFDMGVSQDVDIVLLPSDEPGLYELQLRLFRQSGEISAWRRVNRQFMSDLRKQMLLWRTIKPEGQQEYVLRGLAHVAGEPIPVELPGATVAH